MKKSLFALLSLLSVVFLHAQAPANGNRGGGPQMTGHFYGKVVDSITDKPLEAASVQLIQSRMDSATKTRKDVIVNGMLTDSRGEFSLEGVQVMGQYKLKITAIGFKPIEKTVSFGLKPGVDMMSAIDRDLGNFSLAVDQQVLGNVTIEAGSKPLLQLGIDRKVFNVDKNITSAGGSAVDVMKNVPSVSVDIDGNVTLRNNAPQIFVDGRPTNLTLDQIPADAIESVEIITNPSAKFDASGGTSGILNIVLKKNKRVGYSGNVRSNIDSRGKVGFGGDINIRQNKVNFFASTHINQRKSISNGTTERLTMTDTAISSLQKDRMEMNGMFGFGRAGFDYLIDNRNTLTVSGSMARGQMKPGSEADIFIDSIYNDIIYDSEFQQRVSNSKNIFRNWGTQMSFKHNFPQAGREWTADVTFNKGRNSSTTGITNHFYEGNAIDSSYTQEQMGGGTNENMILQTDYTNPINEKSKFEVGARTSIRKVNSATNYFMVDDNGDKIPVPTQNIIYNSKDQVYAAYATFSSRIKNFGYQLGLRAERSDYEGLLVNKDEAFKIEFPISLFPSLFLTQKLNETSEVQLNYSRRINRPNFWQLFPYTDMADAYNINRGNPNLKPEFTNSIELSYSKSFKNRDNFITSLYFKNTNNLITRYQQIEYVPAMGKELPVTSYINANRSYVTGLELTSRNKVTKFWDITSNANFFTAKIDLQDQPDPEQFLSYFLKLNNSFKLPRNFSLQISADYQSKIISTPGGRGGGGGMHGGGGNSAAQGYIRPNFGVDAAVRYEFLKDKRASFSLNFNDVFRTKKYDAHTESPFFIQDITRSRDPQVLRLNFNYRFGKFDTNLFKRKNTKAEGNMNNDISF